MKPFYLAIMLLMGYSQDGSVKTVKDIRPSFIHERQASLMCIGDNDKGHVCGWQVINEDDPAIIAMDKLNCERGGECRETR